MTSKLEREEPFRLIPSSTDSSPPASGVIPWPPPPDNPSPEPLSPRSIQPQRDAAPIVTDLFQTTLGINLGNNSVVAINLTAEQQSKFQPLLDSASEELKEELECYLAVTDRHGKWRQNEEHVTWFRYHATERTIEYQIHSQEPRYHISLKEIKASNDFSQEKLTRLTDAALKLEKALCEITGITIRHITYEEGSVTLSTGPQPFDKSTTSALKRLADKSFEQALDVVKQQLKRKDAVIALGKNFTALKEALESEKTTAKNSGNAGTAQLLERLIEKLDEMDGFAVAIAASSRLKPKDYEAALKLNDEIYTSVCEQLRVIEENSEPSLGEKLSRRWHGWSDPGEQLAREQGRKAAAKQYAADVLGLCLDHAMAPGNAATLQAASREIYLSLRLVEPSRSIEHALYTYLTTRDTVKLEAFLAECFASLGDPTGQVLAKTVCDKLVAEDAPSQSQGDLIDEEEDLELMAEDDLP